MERRTLSPADLARVRTENERARARIRASAGARPAKVFGGGNPTRANWRRSQALPPTRVHHGSVRYPGEAYAEEDEDLDRYLHPSSQGDYAAAEDDERRFAPLHSSGSRSGMPPARPVWPRSLLQEGCNAKPPPPAPGRHAAAQRA